jgi:thiamine biosynthesis lipoprotein
MMKKWTIFLIVVVVALIYGLVIDKQTVEKSMAQNTKAVEIIPSLYAHDENGLVKREAVLMGSQFVFIAEGDKKTVIDAIKKATEEIRQVEALVSSWKPGSEVYLLNQQAGKFIKVSQHTLHLLKLAKTAHKETQGTFDITIGAVWDLYPFRDPSKPIPSDLQIQEKLQFVNASKIEIDEVRFMAKVPENMRINMGGIAKGYAAGIAIEIMKQQGIQNAAISAGGDTYLLGKKSTGAWKISIENPRWEGKSIEQFLAENISVATSSDSKRYIMRNGKRYGHILDPRTGKPANDAQSVTIITKDPTLADVYATAVYVMGVTEGLKWVEKRTHIEALIVDANGDVHKSSAWDNVTRN